VVPWFMNHNFAVVPDGFAPAGATPLEDFVAKFTGVKYVVDPGSSRERTYAFTNADDLWTGTSFAAGCWTPQSRADTPSGSPRRESTRRWGLLRGAARAGTSG